jgi:hypothetical protein
MAYRQVLEVISGFMRYREGFDHIFEHGGTYYPWRGYTESLIPFNTNHILFRGPMSKTSTSHGLTTTEEPLTPSCLDDRPTHSDASWIFPCLDRMGMGGLLVLIAKTLPLTPPKGLLGGEFTVMTNIFSMQELDTIVDTLRRLQPYWRLDDLPFPDYSLIVERLDEILEVFEDAAARLRRYEDRVVLMVKVQNTVYDSRTHQFKK